jgi:hypothetical protein
MKENIINEEKEILDNLSFAWNNFLGLEQTHPNDINDFMDRIHKCQYILMAREARRSCPTLYKTIKKGEK